MSDGVPAKSEESFGVVVFDGRGPKRRVLLVLSDHWGFPKGHGELGEDGPTAALREVKEETGIIADIPDLSKTMSDQYEVRSDGSVTKKKVTYWIGRGKGDPKPHVGEIIDVRWVTVPQARKLLTYESAKRILESVLYEDTIQ